MIWAGILTVLFTVLFSRWLRNRRDQMPGPKSGWLTSTLWSQAKAGSPDHEALSKQYGPVYQIQELGKSYVVVTAPHLIREVLLHTKDRPRIESVHLPDAHTREFERGLIFAARGEHWKLLRGAWAPMFYTGSLEASMGLMNDEAVKLARRLSTAAAAGGVVDIWALLRDMTLNVIGLAAFGVDLHAQAPQQTPQSEEVCKAQQLRRDAATFFKSFGGTNSRWYRWTVLLPRMARLIRWMATRFPDAAIVDSQAAQRRLMDFTCSLVARHRASLSPDLERTELRKGVRPGSFIEVLARSMQERPEQLSDLQVANQAFSMILAGYETTANLLAYAVHSLAQDPGRATKLCAEIDARPACPTFQSLQDMPYLDAVCHETLRLYPTGGPARRTAGKDMLLGGYRVPKGQAIICNLIAMQHDASLWQTPEAFQPERWLDPSPGAAEPRQHAWKPFGDGPRGCPGWRFAMQEAKVGLFHLFRRFSFRLAPGQASPPMGGAISLSPVHGVLVSVHSR